jgi:hypothetical protein
MCQRVMLPVRNALLFALLLIGLAACAAGGPPANLVAAQQSMPAYPDSEARGTGKPPPGFYKIHHPKDFAADATFFVAGSESSTAIQQYFLTELPKLGWTVEDPPVPSHDDQLAPYCQSPGFIICKSYTKDKVRAIIVTIISFSLGGSAPDGTGYDIHLEEY